MDFDVAGSAVKSKLHAARQKKFQQIDNQQLPTSGDESLRQAPYYQHDPYAPSSAFPQHSAPAPESALPYASVNSDASRGPSNDSNPFSSPPAYTSQQDSANSKNNNHGRLYQTRTHRSATLRSQGGTPYGNSTSPPPSPPAPSQPRSGALYRPNAPSLRVPIPQFPSQSLNHDSPTAEFMSPSDTLVPSALSPDFKSRIPATPDSVTDRDFWTTFNKKAEEAESGKQSKWLKKQDNGRKSLKIAVWTLVIIIALGITAFLVYYFKFRKPSGDTMPSKHEFGLGPHSTLSESASSTSSSSASKRTAIPDIPFAQLTNRHRRSFR